MAAVAPSISRLIDAVLTDYYVPKYLDALQRVAWIQHNVKIRRNDDGTVDVAVKGERIGRIERRLVKYRQRWVFVPAKKKLISLPTP